MKIDIKSLPNDVTLLKKSIIELSTELNKKELAFADLQAKYDVLKSRLYGKSSEKTANCEDGEQELFNAAETYSTEPPAAETTSPEDEITVTYTRKKPGRKPIHDHLPVERVVHDLSKNEKQCSFCHTERPRVSEKSSRKLDVIPAKVKVIEHVYPVYGPCKCQEFKESDQPEMIQPRAVARLIPGSMAGPGLLAYIITAKFVDSLPFYRQEKIFQRLGTEISRENMCNWLILAVKKCQDLLELLWEEIMTSPFLQMDETTVQVLKEDGRPASSKSYMWVNIGYPGEKPIILFHYHPSRSGAIPLELLKNYQEYLQTDGYTGYKVACELAGIVHVGCFAHAHRKFFEAARVTKKASSAQEALTQIRKLYIIEEKLQKQNLVDDDFVRKRKEEVQPILDKFQDWLKTREQQVLAESLLGKAISYTLKEWEKLIRYLDVWFLTPDNNRAENAIRPFVLGRKNWLFSDTPRGAHASSAFYSLVETAKANGLEPYQYLRWLFTRLPQADSIEQKRALLPQRVSSTEICSLDEGRRDGGE